MTVKMASAGSMAMAFAAVLSGMCQTANARTRSHRHPVRMKAPVVSASRHSYYPYNVRGGVQGNLPFNNQLRKLSDPLNANGAR